MKRLVVLLVALTAGALVTAAPSYANDPLPSEATYDPGMTVGKYRAKPTKPPQGVPATQVEPGGGGGCWSTTTTRSRGLYPYNRGLHLYTVWCSNGSVITYRSSSSWPFGDFLCACSSGPHVDKVAGGAGWSFVDVQAWASYACHSPWWFDWNDTLVMRIRYHPNGYYETIYYQ
jgi:hypothetical protein